jgi:hypothetical protein
MRPSYVLGLGLWAPGIPGVDAWRASCIPARGDAPVAPPPCEVLPPRERRALSLTTRMGIEVIGQAATSARVDRGLVGLVFASAYGELETAFDQMEMMAGADGRLSPARFKNSVHNTATGLLSIAFGNRGFGTAIAAGDRSFAAGLLEGLVLLDQEGGAVVVAVADDVPPAAFRGAGRPAFSPLGLALCLAAAPLPPGSATPLGRLEGPARAGGLPVVPGAGAVPESFAGNPAAAGLPLVAALLGRASGWVPIELGATEDPLGVVVAGDGT